jgi:hypothetical protein
MPNALTSHNHLESLGNRKFFNAGSGLPMPAQLESDHGKPDVIGFADDYVN